MKWKSGILELNKTEIKSLKTLINHTKIDMSYGAGGSFNKLDKDYEIDNQSYKLAEQGIEIIQQIIDHQ